MFWSHLFLFGIYCFTSICIAFTVFCMFTITKNYNHSHGPTSGFIHQSEEVLFYLPCFCLPLTHTFWLCVPFSFTHDDDYCCEAFFLHCTFLLQQWGACFVNTEILCIVSSDSFRCTTVVTAQTLSLYSLSVSQIRAWLVQVADRRLSVIVMSEVENVLVKRLITQHLRPFFASSFILQPIMSKTLTNQMWVGSSVPWQQLPWCWLVWQEEHVLLFACLSWLACCVPSPSLLLMFIQKKAENKCDWIIPNCVYFVLH